MNIAQAANDSDVDHVDLVRPRRGSGGLMLGLLLGLTVALVTATVAGALILHSLGSGLALHTSPGFPMVLTVTLVVLVALGIPLWIERSIVRAWRRSNPFARPPVGFALFLCNAVVLALLLLVAPGYARASLLTHGDWMVHGLHGPVGGSLRGAAQHGTAWLASRLPPERSHYVPPQPVLPVQPPAPVAVAPSVVVTPPAPAAVAVPADPASLHVAGFSVVVTPDHDLGPAEVEHLRAATVVAVVVQDAAGAERRGTGVVLDADGLIVTRQDLLAGAGRVSVALPGGGALTPARVVAIDPPPALVLLRVEAHGLAAAPVSQDDDLRLGTRVTVLPAGAARAEAAAGVHSQAAGADFVAIDVYGRRGPLEGALFDPRGGLVGLVGPRAGAADAPALAAHPRHLRELLAAPRIPVGTVGAAGAPTAPARGESGRR